MQLKSTGKTILKQIFDLIIQLSEAEYSAELDLLNGNSIGKHVRHVIEFFELLVSGAAKGSINYDMRRHKPLYETNAVAAMEKLQLLIEEVDSMESGIDLILEVSYADTDKDSIKIKSSIDRELAYNIEHAIHHMAIIKIAIKTVFPKVILDPDFGVAYSTVRYIKSTQSN